MLYFEVVYDVEWCNGVKFSIELCSLLLGRVVRSSIVVYTVVYCCVAISIVFRVVHCSVV